MEKVNKHLWERLLNNGWRMTLGDLTLARALPSQTHREAWVVEVLGQYTVRVIGEEDAMLWAETQAIAAMKMYIKIYEAGLKPPSPE